MKGIAAEMAKMTNHDIATFERDGKFALTVAGEAVSIETGDAEVISEDIPGWLVTNEGSLTVALDIEVSPELRKEGIAREVHQPHPEHPQGFWLRRDGQDCGTHPAQRADGRGC